MAEEMSSLISNGATGPIVELSDSVSSSHLFPSTNKRSRCLSDIICASKFKGVVPQQNGHWGAQIYANHQRIWLGTFKSENEAAMAYDSASIKIRNMDSYRNFPWTNVTIEEPNFQSLYTTEEVLNMIKDGSYVSKFEEFLTNHSKTIRNDVASLSAMKLQDNDGWVVCRKLFQKELTPSDVGKLNRFVIPKKCAVKYFPRLPESMEENQECGGNMDDVQLAFYDQVMKLWKFRYCYWKSSQSYVFTKGWNQFVKQNQLKANDTVIFYLCKCRENTKGGKGTFCMIDVNKVESSNSNGQMVEVLEQSLDMRVDLKLGLGNSMVESVDEIEVEEEMELTKTSDLKLGITGSAVENLDDMEVKEEGEITMVNDFKLGIGESIVENPDDMEVKRQGEIMRVNVMEDGESKRLKLFGVQIL